jgi:hypothetical protein
MESFPIEAVFIAAILFVVLLGTVAIVILLSRAKVALTGAGAMRGDAMSRVDRSISLQEEAVKLTREAIELQRESNRLLSELLAHAKVPSAREP